MKSLFYKPLAFKPKDDNDIVFWSDTHFGHACVHWPNPLWSMRGFSSVIEHDEILIQRWNRVSTQETTFFHLGDFMFGQDADVRFKQCISRLNFKTLYLMPGNHNSGWRQNFNAQAYNVWEVDTNKQVVFVPNYLELYVHDQPIVLSHYPLAAWNGQGKGSIMLHGHSHGNIYKDPIGEMLYKALILDVGIERFPNPLTYRELKIWASRRTAVTFDHHSSRTANPF